MANQRLENLQAWILNLLERGLTPRHYYHGAAHTLDVAAAAARNAEGEGIDPAQRELVLAGALLHDTGFVERYADNESAAKEICRKALPGFGYDEEEISMIGGLILATRLPQRPATSLQRILCDADLDYLGRPDYFELSDRLYREWAAFGRVLSEHEWIENQLAFLGAHQYFLPSVRALRDAGKAANLEMLRRRYERLRLRAGDTVPAEGE